MTAIRLFSKPCGFIEKNFSYFSTSSFICRKMRELFLMEYGIYNIFDNDRDAIDAAILFAQNHEQTMR